MNKDALAQLVSERDKGMLLVKQLRDNAFGNDSGERVYVYACSVYETLDGTALTDYAKALDWKRATDIRDEAYPRLADCVRWMERTLKVLTLAVSQAGFLSADDTLTGLKESAKEIALECNRETFTPDQFDCFVVAWLKCAYDYCITSGNTAKARLLDPHYHTSGDNGRRLKETREYLERRIEIINSLTSPVPQAESRSTANLNSRTIFLIYGHDATLKSEVKEFLRRLQFEPIDLADEPAGGLKSILEKFKGSAETAGFAVALLTADDVGGKKDGEQKPRGRQNVILEIGYFIGRLGPERVCVICDDDLEIPSDILGQHYLKQSNWELPLVRELEEAKFVVDRRLI